MTYLQIRQLLENRLATCKQANDIQADLVYENLSYTPTPTSTPYIRSEFVPNTRRPTSLGQNPTELLRGLYVITPYLPSDAGPKTADDMAELIMGDHGFKAAQILAGPNGDSLTVEYTERQRGFLEAPWYYVPIIVAWRVYK